MGIGDRLRAAFGMQPRTFDTPPVVRLMAEPTLPVDQLLLFAQSRLGRVGREEALTVPAVLRGRNMICNIATLPLQAVDEQNRVQDRPLFRQIDRNTPNVVVMAQTIEDLLFEGVSWWRVVGFDADGMPSSCQRYAPEQVSLQPPADYQRGLMPSGLATEGVVWMEGKTVPFEEVIRFDSPNPGLLTAGGRVIRRALTIDHAADLYGLNPRRRGFFSPQEGVDPVKDGAILDMLDAWAESSKERLDGYVPAAVKYTPIQDSTPAELQLIQMQKQVGLDLANAIGVDPEDLGVSTTSRTYQNGTDRRQDRINEALAPYMRAITDRLGMPDVTRPNLKVRFYLGEWLKADPKTRAEVQSIYAGLGATDGAEIREEEGKPPRRIEAPAAPQAPRQVESTVGDPVQEITAASAPTATFARDSLSFDFQASAAFAVDVQARTITGLAVPWGQVARSNGRRFRFAKGSVKWSSVNRVKLLRDHAIGSAIGKAVALTTTDAGLVATFKVSAGAAGDEALALAVDEVLDGLSIGVDFTEADLVAGPDGVYDVSSSALREISLTAVPAFDDSRLTSVQAARQEGNGMPEAVPTNPPAPAAVEPAAPAVDTAVSPAAVTLTDVQFAALVERITPTATEVRPTVDPTRGAAPVAVVNEALPYRFSYEGGRTIFQANTAHDFSTDVYAILRARETGADFSSEVGRVNSMISAAFAVDRAGVTDSTVPNRYRPDLWQPQMDYITPLWDMIDSGTTDGTKFEVPKFNSSSALVGPATETVEPAPGAFTATLQTITPTQVWGKVEITRQAWRAGGNPQLSGILWDQMLREYYEDREAAVATFLNTLTAAADITITAGAGTNASDLISVANFEDAVTLLQFVRGGNRFSAMATHVDLYKVFARVKDSSGRPLYPQINPMNANGTATALWRYIDVGGTRMVPAWALGATGTAAANSWLFDPAKVRGWASAPERLFWDFGATVQTANIPQLSHVTMGIYGDVAFANLDIAGVRQVIYDPVA